MSVFRPWASAALSPSQCEGGPWRGRVLHLRLHAVSHVRCRGRLFNKSTTTCAATSWAYAVMLLFVVRRLASGAVVEASAISSRPAICTELPNGRLCDTTTRTWWRHPPPCPLRNVISCTRSSLSEVCQFSVAEGAQPLSPTGKGQSYAYQNISKGKYAYFSPKHGISSPLSGTVSRHVSDKPERKRQHMLTQGIAGVVTRIGGWMRIIQ